MCSILQQREAKKFAADKAAGKLPEISSTSSSSLAGGRDKPRGLAALGIAIDKVETKKEEHDVDEPVGLAQMDAEIAAASDRAAKRLAKKQAAAEQARIEAEEAQKSDTKDVVAKRMAQEKAKKAAKEAKAAEKAVREAAEKEAKDKEAFMQAKASERGSAEE